MLRLLIVSPYPAMRAGLAALIQEADRPQVVAIGSVDSALSAAEWVQSGAVDAILYDLSLESAGDAAGLVQLRRAAPRPPILVLSDSANDSRILPALQAGARGCVSKTISGVDLIDAVEDVIAGSPVLPPNSTAALLEQLRGDSPSAGLSPREVEVLRAVAAGLTNKAIAAELGVSDRTVQGHLASIYGKLAVASRTEAVTKALKLGWLVLDDA